MTFKQRFLFSFFMALIMGFFMSFIMVSMIVGFTPNFFEIWMTSFVKNSSLAFPAAFLVAPIASKITDFFLKKFQNPTALKRRVIFALIMPAFMDFIIATFSTAILIGFNSEFFENWIKAYLTGFTVAAPLAFFVAPIAMNLAKKILK